MGEYVLRKLTQEMQWSGVFDTKSLQLLYTSEACCTEKAY